MAKMLTWYNSQRRELLWPVESMPVDIVEVVMRSFMRRPSALCQAPKQAAPLLETLKCELRSQDGRQNAQAVDQFTSVTAGEPTNRRTGCPGAPPVRCGKHPSWLRKIVDGAMDLG